MDSLTYYYERITSNQKLLRNRLYHVKDAISGTPAYLQDITDQGAFNTSNINSTNNYGFDELGNLVRDNAELITNIEWTVYGKIKTITRLIGSPKNNLSFDYDAQGNRIAKHVYNSSNQWQSSTYYIRDAQGNVMDVYQKTEISRALSYKQVESHIYGSSRLGLFHPNLEMIGATISTADTTKYYLGNKTYELSNHLGNVLATISDKKIALDVNSDKVIDGFVTDLVSAEDYYPFGSPMPGRQFNNGSYRYAFNGKENDNEVKGTGNSVDFGERIYDPRLGRWLSIDAQAGKYCSWSPYSFGLDNPIRFVDIAGETIGDPNSPSTLMAKSQLQKTDAGKVLWKQLESSEKVIYFHQAIADGTPEEKKLYKATGQYLFGATVGKAQFGKISNGEKTGIDEMKQDYKFNTSTGVWETSSKEIHIIINVSAIKLKYTIDGLVKGESEEAINKKVDDATQFTVAEESIHSLEKSADFSNSVKDEKTGKYIEPQTIEEATSKPYKKRNNEIEAHKKAEKTTGVKNPQN